MKIKKTSETTPATAEVVNQRNTTTTNTYSCNYNNTFFDLVTSLLPSKTEVVTNNNGTALKFDNGIMICFKKILITADVTNTWGSLYESGDKSLGNFPVAFISAPVVSAINAGTTNTGVNGGWIEYIQNVSATSCGTLAILRPTSGSGSFNINIIAIGRWKN